MNAPLIALGVVIAAPLARPLTQEVRDVFRSDVQDLAPNATPVAPVAAQAFPAWDADADLNQIFPRPLAADSSRRASVLTDAADTESRRLRQKAAALGSPLRVVPIPQRDDAETRRRSLGGPDRLHRGQAPAARDSCRRTRTPVSIQEPTMHHEPRTASEASITANSLLA